MIKSFSQSNISIFSLLLIFLQINYPTSKENSLPGNNSEISVTLPLTSSRIREDRDEEELFLRSNLRMEWVICSRQINFVYLVYTYSFNKWTDCLWSIRCRRRSVESANILNLCACAVFKRTEIQGELQNVCPGQQQQNTRAMLTLRFGTGQIPIHAPST